MSMTIGRAALATDPTSISQTGDTFTFTIDVIESTLAGSKAVRQQLLGLEVGEVIPLTWTEDADFDGFYSVDGVTMAPSVVYLSNFLMRTAVTVTRVRGGYGAAFTELVWSVVDNRPTVNYGTLTAGPGAAVWVPASVLTLGSAGGSRSTLDGGVRPIDEGLTPASASYSGETSSAFRLAPGDFYQAACRIDGLFGGAWYPMTGRQLPSLNPEEIRLSNGVITTTIDMADGEVELVRYPAADIHRWSLADTSEGPLEFVDAPVSVLRNSPEACTIQLPMEGVFSGGVTANIVLSIQRGGASIFLTADPSTNAVDVQYQGPTSPTTSQAISTTTTYLSGHIATTKLNDYYYFGVPEGSPTASTTGLLEMASGETVEIGLAINSAAEGEATLGVRKSERQRIIT